MNSRKRKRIFYKRTSPKKIFSNIIKNREKMARKFNCGFMKSVRSFSKGKKS